MRPLRPSPDHIWITTFAEYDADLNLIREEGYWYEGPVAQAGGGMVPTIDQEHYRIRDDNTAADPGTPNWISTEDQATRTAIDVDKMFRIRFVIANTGSGNANSTWALYFSHNGGTYTAVSASGTAVITANATTPTDGDTLSTANFQLTAGTGSAQNGEYDEDNSISSNLTSGGYEEFEFCVQLNSAVSGGIATGDTFNFIVYYDGAQADNPTQVALVEAAGPRANGTPSIDEITASGTATVISPKEAFGATGSVSYVGGAADSTASGTSVTVTVSGIGIQQNDVVVAICHGNNVTETWEANTDGFTDYFGETNPSVDTSAYAILYKVAGASEPTTYTFNSGQAADRNQVSVVVFRGVDTSTIWDVAPSASTRNNADTGTTATAPTMTLSTADCGGIVAFMRDGAATFNTVTNSYTNEVTAATTQQCLHVWTRIFTSSGASGTTQATLSATDAWVAQQFAVTPAPGLAIDEITASGTVHLKPKVWLNSSASLSGATELTVTAFNTAGTSVTFDDPGGSPTGSNLYIGVENRNAGGGADNTGWLSGITVSDGNKTANGTPQIDEITASGTAVAISTRTANGTPQTPTITASATVHLQPKVWLNSSASLSGATELTVTAFNTAGTSATFTDPVGPPTGSNLHIGVENRNAGGGAANTGWLSGITVNDSTKTANGTPQTPTITASGTVVQIQKPSGTPSIDEITASGTASFLQDATGTPLIDEITASGTVTWIYKASGTPSIDEITASGSVTQIQKPSGTPSIDEITASGMAASGAAAAGNAVMDAVTASGTVVQEQHVSATVTMDAVTASGTAGFLQDATGTVQAPETTASGTVAATYTAEGTPSIDEITASGTVSWIYNVSGAVLWPDVVRPMTVSATVDQIQKPSGTPSIDEITASGTVVQEQHVSAAVTADEITASGTVTQIQKVTGTPSIDEITASASASNEETLIANGTPQIDTITASGTVTQIQKPSGTPSIDTITASGSVTQDYQVTGSITIETVTASGTVIRILGCQGTPQLLEITATATVDQTYKPSGTPSIDTITASGIAVKAGDALFAFGNPAIDAVTASGSVTQIQTLTSAATMDAVTASGLAIASDSLLAYGSPTTPTVTANADAGRPVRVWLNTIRDTAGATELTVTYQSGDGTTITFTDPVGGPTGDNLFLGVENFDGIVAWISGVSVISKPAYGTAVVPTIVSSGNVKQGVVNFGTPSIPTITASGVAERFAAARGAAVVPGPTTTGQALHPVKVWLNTSETTAGATQMVVTSQSDDGTTITFRDPVGSPVGSPLYLGVETTSSPARIAWIEVTVNENTGAAGGNATIPGITASGAVERPGIAEASSQAVVPQLTASGTALTRDDVRLVIEGQRPVAVFGINVGSAALGLTTHAPTDRPADSSQILRINQWDGTWTGTLSDIDEFIASADGGSVSTVTATAPGTALTVDFTNLSLPYKEEDFISNVVPKLHMRVEGPATAQVRVQLLVNGVQQGPDKTITVNSGAFDTYEIFDPTWNTDWTTTQVNSMQLVITPLTDSTTYYLDCGEIYVNYVINLNVVRTPATRPLALSGKAPTRIATADNVEAPDAGYLVPTTYAPTLGRGTTLTPAAATLSATGYAPTDVKSDVALPGQLQILLAQYAPELLGAGIYLPDTATLDLTGAAPSLNTTIGVPAGSLAVESEAPVSDATDNHVASPPRALLTPTGQIVAALDGAVTYSQPPKGILSIDSEAPDPAVTRNAWIDIPALDLTITTYQDTTIDGTVRYPDAGTLTAEGQDLDAYPTTIIGVPATSLSVDTYQPALGPLEATLVVAGSAPTVEQTTLRVPAAASLNMQGWVPVGRGSEIFPLTGALTLETQAPTVQFTTFFRGKPKLIRVTPRYGIEFVTHPRKEVVD